jgi:hypothetical protein
MCFLVVLLLLWLKINKCNVEKKKRRINKFYLQFITSASSKLYKALSNATDFSFSRVSKSVTWKVEVLDDCCSDLALASFRERYNSATCCSNFNLTERSSSASSDALKCLWMLLLELEERVVLW